MALRLLPIARPCGESFAAMSGDAKRRFCETCDKHVHDLSARSEEEARELLHANRGTRICVRFARNENGSVRFKTAALATAAALSLGGCTAAVPEQPVQDPSSYMEMGDMVPDAVDKCPYPPTAESIADGCPPDLPSDPDGGAK